MLGDWVLHADLGVLRRGAEEKRLTAKALHVLLVLVDAGDRAVSREELLDSVWGESYPADAVVSRAIADLRNAFGEAAGDQAYIRTVPKFGYQLIAGKTPPAKPRRALAASLLIVVTLLFVLAWWFWPAGDDAPAGSVRLPEAKPLTAAPGLEHQPRMAGGWIVYAALRPGQSDWDLFRVSANDNIAQAIAAMPGVNEHGPAVSPQGDELAYVRMDHAACEVVVQSMTFGVPEPVAECTMKFPTLVDWSPDARHIVYTASEANDVDGYRRLHAVDRFTGDTVPVSVAVSPSGSDFYPRYSPSGRYIAFLRGEPQPDHRTSLWIVAVETGDETRLTPQPAQHGGMSWIDATSLVYSVNDAGRFELRKFDLVTGNAQRIAGPDIVHPHYDVGSGTLVAALRRTERDLASVDTGKNVTTIASSTSDDHHGVFSPDGEFIAFISRRSGYDELWISDRNGDTLRRVTHLDGTTIRYPAWHPDGQRILFTAQTAAGERLFVVDLVSGASEELPAIGNNATTPAWLADGEHWVYGCQDDAGWGLCVGGDGDNRRLVDNYYRPQSLAGNFIAAVDGSGALHRIDAASGDAQLIWERLPAAGRLGWVLHGDSLVYSTAAADNDSGQIRRRNLVDGTVDVIFEGRMPLADNTLSIDPATGRLLFTRFQAASDDLVSFDLRRMPVFGP